MASLPCSDAVHHVLKKYCVSHNLKIKDVVDQAIKKFLKEKGVEI